jgi:hypothetical protein
MVGTPMTSGQMDNILTSLANRYRDLSQVALDLSIQVSGQGNGLAYLESIGYASDPNPANPGGVSDAQWALNLISYFGTNAGVWFGTAAQASEFSFNNAVAPLWAGQFT